MDKIKTITYYLIIFLLSIAGIVSSFFRLNEYYEFETLQEQIEHGYKIVYIDPTYLIEYTAFLLFIPFYWYFWKVIFYGKEHTRFALKAVIIGTTISMILIIPGQFIEHQRLRNIAITHGYTGCPSFTLLSSAHIVEAMVKNPQFCTDEEINKISMYGYFRELPVVNEYIRSAYGFDE